MATATDCATTKLNSKSILRIRAAIFARRDIRGLDIPPAQSLDIEAFAEVFLEAAAGNDFLPAMRTAKFRLHMGRNNVDGVGFIANARRRGRQLADKHNSSEKGHELSSTGLLQ